MPVLLRDVALVAGCSTSTVSRALRGDPCISTATRQRVTAAAANLGYRPDPLLGALASYRDRRRSHARTDTVVYVSTWPAGRRGAAGDRQTALEVRCAELGYQLEYLSLTTTATEQRAAGARLVARGVRGLLLGTGMVQQDQLDLPWTEFACVSVSGAPRMRYFPSVTANYAQHLQVALSEAALRGYRRPGLVIDAWTRWATREANLTGWGHAFDFGGEAPVRPLSLSGDQDGRALAAWIAIERIDVVIAFSPQLLPLLRKSGQQIPYELGFVALDTYPGNGVAGIEQARETCALVAFDLLANRLHRHEYGPLAKPYTLHIEGTWIDAPSLRAQR